MLSKAHHQFCPILRYIIQMIKNTKPMPYLAKRKNSTLDDSWQVHRHFSNFYKALNKLSHNRLKKKSSNKKLWKLFTLKAAKFEEIWSKAWAFCSRSCPVTPPMAANTNVMYLVIIKQVNCICTNGHNN